VESLGESLLVGKPDTDDHVTGSEPLTGTGEFGGEILVAGEVLGVETSRYENPQAIIGLGESGSDLRARSDDHGRNVVVTKRTPQRRHEVGSGQPGGQRGPEESARPDHRLAVGKQIPGPGEKPREFMVLGSLQAHDVIGVGSREETESTVIGLGAEQGLDHGVDTGRVHEVEAQNPTGSYAGVDA
jgi:hypothetical protein